ncbi:sugar phosphate isomerase/epimerase [Clostridium boliviensis]|uniref:Sugar phosphate isomerase/epimerase n=1 Tax=Clostridium boliviensis TaxID=318465 RepID=A0ABU4GSL0_9CLOT|nr:sugar phosphate isomerase/epimerase [Clostridium boliviensis]MDW2800631.1 sugar phosphate isomerase/epimerase [Clostridium boliviensis]
MSLIEEFSIQLYSLRELTIVDFPGVLKRVAEIGYTGVEFAGYGDLSASQMRSLLEENGLKSISSHVPLERLINDLDEELSYNREIGTKTIIVPYHPLKTIHDVEILAEQLAPIAKAVRSAGFTFGYHNHAHEFVKTEDGTFLLDLLMQLTDPQDVVLELDVYWAAYAGVDVLEYMEKQRKRIRLLHLKQMTDFESRKCVDLDEGVLDFNAIICKGLEIGVQHCILEQEDFAVSPYQSIEKGYKHIMNL